MLKLVEFNVDFYWQGKLKFKVNLSILKELGKLFSACLSKTSLPVSIGGIACSMH